MKMAELIKDLLTDEKIVTYDEELEAKNKGGFDDLEMACMYNNMKMKFGLDAGNLVKNVTDVEEKMFNYFKKEGIAFKTGHFAPCHMFVATKFKDLKLIVVPEEYIDPETEEKAEHRICALAHELGHYLHYKYHMWEDYDWFSYHAKTHLIHCEVAGWYYGQMVLEALGYENWDKFEKQKYESLLTYTFGDKDVLDEHLEHEKDIMFEVESNFIDEEEYDEEILAYM